MSTISTWYCYFMMTTPFCFYSGNHKQKFYWGHKEIMIPGKAQSTNMIVMIIDNAWNFSQCIKRCQKQSVSTLTLISLSISLLSDLLMMPRWKPLGMDRYVSIVFKKISSPKKSDIMISLCFIV